MEVDFGTAIGRRIRSAREARGMSVLDLAEATGVPSSDIEAYEEGVKIAPHRADAIASVLRTAETGLVRLVPSHWDSRGEVSPPSTEEGLRLLRHFTCITDRRRRAALIDMARSLGDAEAPGEGPQAE